MREVDAYTIRHEPVSPHALMERASRALAGEIAALISRNNEIIIFAGTGNNGGDGLAIARMLATSGYNIHTCILNISPSRSPEWEENLKLLTAITETRVTNAESAAGLPVLSPEMVIIDAIFGSGINRSPEGVAAAAIRLINDFGGKVISVDVPSGLPGENTEGFDSELIVRASYTLVLQAPRLSFMFPENHRYTGEWRVVPIGLHPAGLIVTESPYHYSEGAEIANAIRRRRRNEHKGNFGHALLAAGSFGKMGAAILGARAALRTGAGLLTCHIPAKGYHIMQISVPEAMVETDQSEIIVSEIREPDRFDAIGIGPGIGCKPNARKAVATLLNEYNGPLVIDADALNILALNPELLKLAGERAILTPHPGEFARLAGDSSSGYEQLEKQIAFSGKYNCVVVLKGANTSVSLPDGNVFFNSTGNPGMATAGSGDVLTGVILGLLSQGYSPASAAITGVYLHGLAGDIAAGLKCMESLIASDITENLHSAYTKLREHLL